MSQWVQHISGQGEKWQVHNETFPATTREEWCVRAKLGGLHYLPKSEYVPVPVEPEKVWRNVTSECEFAERGNHLILPCHVVPGAKTYTKLPDGYRLRKVKGWPNGESPKVWFFIVERYQV